MPDPRSSAADLLRALAEERDFARALSRFPRLDPDTAARILADAADALAPREPAPAPRASVPAPRPSPPTGARVRQVALPFPAGGRVRLYCDGASRGNPGPAGAGAVLMDEKGEVIERLGKFLGEKTNNVAEYSGLLLGLHRARELGATEVEVLSDSELLVKQLAGEYRVKNEGLKPLHLEAQSLLRSFRRFSVRHIPREENAMADEMSNRAIDERM